MPKAILQLVIALLILSLTACGFKDIDNRFFVICVGIDEGKNHPYKVSLMLDIPSSKSEPGKSNALIISKEADSIAEAVRLMKSNVDKELDFGQTKIFVIGKRFARQHELKSSLDWLFRRRDIQQIAYLAIGEPDAATILNTNPKSERLRGNAMILALSGNGSESPYTVQEPLFDYFRRVNSHGEDAYMPIIRSHGDHILIDRVYAFSGDHASLELTPQETAAFNQLVMGQDRFIVKLPVAGQLVTFSATKIHVHYRFAQPLRAPSEVRFNIHVEVDVEDSPVSLFYHDWHQVERLIAEELQTQYMSLLKKLQEHHSDPVGLGIEYRAVNHQGDAEIAAWKDIYPELKFRVNVHVKFKSTGIIE